MPNFLKLDEQMRLTTLAQEHGLDPATFIDRTVRAADGTLLVAVAGGVHKPEDAARVMSGRRAMTVRAREA